MSITGNEPNLWIYLAEENWRAFCANNALNIVDPLGLDNLNLIPPAPLSDLKGWDAWGTPNDHGKGKNQYTVAAHSDGRYIYGPDGKRLDIGDLADRIKNDPDYDPTKPVRLNACYAGVSGGPADQLSKRLGNTVWGPTGKLRRWGYSVPFTGRTKYILKRDKIFAGIWRPSRP